MSFLSNLKWNATTIIAVLLTVLNALKAYMDANVGKPFDYVAFAFLLLTAISSFFIGTNPDGSKKTPTQVTKANTEAEVTAVK